jgi:hypothetical protein
MLALRMVKQELTFAGVNTRHQTNGKTERCIEEIQEMARSMLVHASTMRWSNSVTANLWPYTVQTENSKRCNQQYAVPT